MNKIMKMSEKILSHALEIISLLTGQVSLLHHLSKSLTVIEKKDKKLTEDILNHTLEILYLLTGEEYTISKKKNSPHNRNHQLIGECDVVRHKETPTENCHPRRTLGMPATKSLGLQDENMDAVSEEGCDEIDEKEILKVTIHSDLYAGLPDENVYSVSINEEGKYQRDGNDILHPDPCAESSSVNSDLLKQEEELKSRDQQQFKEEEIPVNIIKVT